MRTITLALLTFAIVALSATGGQEPPDKPEPPDLLKKKVRPEPPATDKDKPAEAKPKEEPKQKAETRPGEEPKEKTDPGPNPEKQAQEILDRIARNIKEAEERLKAKDPGDGTQQVQRDIVKDLDALIEQSQKQQQQQQDQQAGAGMGGGKQQGKSGSRSSRSSRGQKSGSQNAGKQGQGDQSAQGNQGQPNQPGQGGNQPGAGGMSAAGVNKLADLYKDVWGHLPETLRQELDAYQKEGYMTKYRELLKQYYATLAEKARRSAEGER